MLLISCDDLNQELGCYGNLQAQTLIIDRLAERGLRFERPPGNPRSKAQPKPAKSCLAIGNSPWSRSTTAPLLPRQLPQLQDLSLSDDPDLANFAGTIRHRKTIHLSKPTTSASLSLGRVNGTSRLLVDGQEAGVRWYGVHRYELGTLSAGSHEIGITTTLGDYIRSLGENTTAMQE